MAGEKASDYRLFVNRILNATARPRDLMELLLWLRFNSAGNLLLKDIGDFCGHREARNRGSTFQAMQHYAAHLNWFIPRVRSKSEMKPGSTAEYHSMLIGTVERWSDDWFRHCFKKSKSWARQSIRKSIRKIEVNDQGQPVLNGRISERDFGLVQAMSEVLIGDGFYNGNMLMDELVSALSFNKLLAEDEFDAFRARQSWVEKFCVERMHRYNIDIEGGPAFLFAAVEGSKLNISSEIPIQFEDGNTINVASIYFQTDVEIDGHDRAILRDFHIEVQEDWSISIEPII